MDHSSTKTPNYGAESMGALYRFFCWCSGARLYLLKQCPTDYNKYLGIGVVVFLTGLMAALSGGYAAFTIFGSAPAAISVGMFWGVTIFFIDWYLIASLKKQANIGKEFLSTFPRLILAVFLAVVISKPLELRLFDKEIQLQLAALQQERSQNLTNSAEREFSEISRLRTENDELTAQIREKEKQRNALFQLFIAEAEGNGGTGRAGKGPVYNEKKQQYNRVDAELKDLKAGYEPRVQRNLQRLSELEALRDVQLNHNRQIAVASNGFLARLEAFGQLTDQNRNLALVNWFVVLLFVCIESAPVLVKLMAKRGPYDILLDYEEHLVKMKTNQALNSARLKAENQMELERQKARMEFEAGLINNEEFIAKLQEAQAEINSRKVDKWKSGELSQVELREMLTEGIIFNQDYLLQLHDAKTKREDPPMDPRSEN